jgi:hypothetical protein
MRRVAGVGCLAVCLLLFAGGSVATSASAKTGASTGSGPGIVAVLPADAVVGPGQLVSIPSVSCPSAGNCAAVGSYLPKHGVVGGGALLFTETTGGWAKGVEAVLPSNARIGELTSVSCASVGYCSAVGNYTDQAGTRGGLLLTEKAGRWLPGVEVTWPNVDLRSVSCGSAGNCSAVGGGVLVVEKAGKWLPGQVPELPANAMPGHPQLSLNSVSCPSAGDCAVVGSYAEESGSRGGLLLNERAGTWRRGQGAVLPADASSQPWTSLASVSCSSAGNCSAVGTYNNATSGGVEGNGLLLTETRGNWTTGVEAPVPADALQLYPEVLTDVSCPSPGNCAAVGHYTVPNPTDSGALNRPLVLSERANVWSQSPLADAPPLGGYGGLASVSCPSVGNCTAVGIFGGAVLW